MSPQIDSKLAKVMKECGLTADSCWKHKQSGKWIVYHWACEIIAVKLGIKFLPPTIIAADPINKIATILVTGTLGDRTEWSFGEAAPYNTQQTYPFSMCEKRGKDRVILKLAELHGLAYSEEEADDFKQPTPSPPPQSKSAADTLHGPRNITTLKAEMRAFAQDLASVSDLDELTAMLNERQDLLDQCMRDLPSWWQTDEGHGAFHAIAERRKDLEVTLQEREPNHV